jgi:hypothetical protein
LAKPVEALKSPDATMSTLDGWDGWQDREIEKR